MVERVRLVQFPKLNPPSPSDEDVAVWGELREGLHVAGYTFERACRRLEILLEGDRWKVNGRFKDVNEFLDSLHFDELRAPAEARRRIANRIKELQPKASNRQIAKTLGCNRSTIDRDTGANAPRQSKKPNEKNQPRKSVGAFAPCNVSGTKAAKIVERRTTDIAVVQQRRAERERELGTKIMVLPDKKYGVILADPEWHDISTPASYAIRRIIIRPPTSKRSRRGLSPTSPPTTARCSCGR
jgi:hypothetical protein